MRPPPIFLLRPLSVSASESTTHTDSDDDDDLENLRAKILEGALKHVPREGWSREAISAAVDDLKLSPACHGLVTNGGVDLVHSVMDLASKHVANAMNSADLSAIPVNERIVLGVRSRLEFIAPYRLVWAQAMALGALPQHLPATAERLLRSADDLWWLAGDTSTDIHWYSRRLLLCSVIVASELHLITDASTGNADTWAFIERRVNDVSAFGRGAGEALSVGRASAEGVGSILTATVSLLQPIPQFLLQQLGQHVQSLDTAAKSSNRGPNAAVPSVLLSLGSMLVPGAGGAVDALATSLLPREVAAAGDAVVRSIVDGSNRPSHFTPPPVDSEIEQNGTVGAGGAEQPQRPVELHGPSLSGALDVAVDSVAPTAAKAAATIGRSGPGAAVSSALRSLAPTLVPGTGGAVDALAKSLLPRQVAATGEAVVRGLFGGSGEIRQ